MATSSLKNRIQVQKEGGVIAVLGSGRPSVALPDTSIIEDLLREDDSNLLHSLQSETDNPARKIADLYTAHKEVFARISDSCHLDSTHGSLLLALDGQISAFDREKTTPVGLVAPMSQCAIAHGHFVCAILARTTDSPGPEACFQAAWATMGENPTIGHPKLQTILEIEAALVESLAHAIRDHYRMLWSRFFFSWVPYDGLPCPGGWNDLDKSIQVLSKQCASLAESANQADFNVGSDVSSLTDRITRSITAIDIIRKLQEVGFENLLDINSVVDSDSTLKDAVDVVRKIVHVSGIVSQTQMDSLVRDLPMFRKAAARMDKRFNNLTK